MSVQKKDYRTNRADYAIAAKHGRATAEGDELPARKKKSLLARDRRSEKLTENPSESAPEPKARTRG
jgi:Mg-chelatase subunit ChlI